MLGGSDDMNRLPNLQDSDDDELMALEDQLPGHSQFDDNDDVLNRLRSVDDDGEDINDLQILQGGNATNLDNMTQDQVLHMINSQMNDDEHLVMQQYQSKKKR